jgi:hypothetical protein
LDNIDTDHRNVEFFGGDLSKRRADPGAEVDLPSINRHHPLFIDGEEPIDLVGRDSLRRRHILRLGRQLWERKRHDQRPGSFQELPARRPKG